MSKWSSAFRDSRWQKLRLEIMERDGWTCKSCGASGKGVTLNVHHAYYESGKAPWEYPADTLVTWCEDCHGKIHEAQKRLALIIARHDFAIAEDKASDVIAFLTGVYDCGFGGGGPNPSLDTVASYCKGYAVGSFSVSLEEANKIVKQSSFRPTDRKAQ